MRLFFIEWVGKEFGMTEIVAELKHRGHEIVYWTGPDLDREVDQTQFPGTIFHDHTEALFARPASGVDQSAFPPPGAPLIVSFAETESEILTMMSKLFEEMPVNERKTLYYRYLRYWSGVIAQFRPETIIFSNVPHTVYDFVLYSLARRQNIPTILFEVTRVNARSLLVTDFEKGSASLRATLRQNASRHYALSDLAPDVRAYYEKQIALTVHTHPQDVIDFLKKFSGLRVFKVKLRSLWTTLTVHKDPTVFLKVFTYLPRRFGRNQKTEYMHAAKAPDFGKKFVYVALQYQPECSTSPLGGVFVNQLLMIETLSAALPHGWEIFVKEHPLQWKPRGVSYFSYRYRGYYDRISAVPHVRLVPLDTDSFSLIEKSQCVAVVTGTAGWEALLRGKPALIFGYAAYADCRGVFQVNDVTGAKRALDAVKDGARVTRQEMIDYLYSFGQVTLPGFREEYSQAVSRVSVAENIANHVRALEHALRKKEL